MGPTVEVVVQDPGWCVPERDLRAALAEVPLRRGRVEVVVTADRDTRRIELRVEKRSRTEWLREWEVTADACASAPEMIAASVRRHLIDTDPPGLVVIEAKVPVAASLSVLDWDRGTSVGAIGVPRLGAGVRFEVGLTSGDLLVGAQAEGGPRFPLGAGEARLGEGVVSVGLGLHGPGEWRLSGGVAGGAAVAQGYGFLEDRTSVGPVAFGWLGVGNRVLPALDVGLGLRVHAVRPRVVAGYDDGLSVAASLEEPWVRAEVTLAPRVKSLKVRRSGGHQGGR